MNDKTLEYFLSFCSLIFDSYCWMKIYEKLRQPNAWFAFIPFLNIWIRLKAGDRSFFWYFTFSTVFIFSYIVLLSMSNNITVLTIILFIILLVTLVISSYIYISACINIIKKLGKNHWLILLTIIPFVNLWVMYYFAFSKDLVKVSNKGNSQRKIDKNKEKSKVKKSKQKL